MKLMFLLLAVLIATSGVAQTFEGKIVYTNSYKSKIPGVTDEQLTAMMGERQEYYIKGGQYKSVANGTLFQWQVYNNRENMLYNKMSNSDTLLRIDASTGGDELLDITSLRAAGKVLGYECDQVTLTGKSGKLNYLYSSKIAVDPENYRGHVFGNWYQYLEKAKALPLWAILENSQFILEMTATEVTPQKLDDAFFQVTE